MDKRSIIGFALIGVVIIVWMVYVSINQKPVPKPQQKSVETEEVADTTKTVDSKLKENALKPSPMTDSLQANTDSLVKIEKYGREFAPLCEGKEDIIHIETDLIKAKINTKGATILEWELKKYKHWSGAPTQLINNDIGELFLSFDTKNKNKIDTRDLYFTFDNQEKLHYTVTGKDSLVLVAHLPAGKGREIVKRFTFYGDNYSLGLEVSMVNMDNLVNKSYNLIWEDGVRFQEHNSVDESNEAVAMVQKKGENEDIAGSEKGDTLSPKEQFDYALVKCKYFAAAIMPQNIAQYDGEVGLSGYKYPIAHQGANKKFRMTVKKPYTGGIQNQSYKVFMGPLDYDIVSSYGLEKAINLGWRWLVRPIGELLMLPLFKMIHMFVANYGISIILFSIIIKLLLYPLSISQMRSAQKMKLITPETTAIREKFKDDPKKQQQEIMKMYSEYGINPAGGCLPLLLQMPILYALWAVLRTAIDLRQANFFLWITDLSMPDVIVSLPFKIPLFNVDQFSGLAILMGITMFIQQKLTLTDPRQKAMVYMMPVMFTFMFSGFPSGLNLYYFMFNLLSILQQVYINKFSKASKLTKADLRRMPKKEGFIQKKMREAQDIATSRGKALPGASGTPTQHVSSKSKYQRKKK